MATPTKRSPSPIERFVRDPTLEELRTGADPDSYPSDSDERGLAWAAECATELDRNAPIFRELRNYRAGIQPIKFSTEAWRETYGDDFGMVVDNICEQAIEAATERMTIDSFALYGTDNLDDEALGDWQRNGMDLRADIVHDDMLTTGYSYVLAWPGADDLPEYTVEDPINAIVITDPANRRRRLAGFKRWRQRDGKWGAIVWTPDRFWQLVAGEKPGDWTVTDRGPNVMEVVPLVAFVNNPNVYGYGRSDLLPILTLQDAVNKLHSDTMVVAEHAGYPQRIVLGLEEPQNDPRDTEDDDGDPDTPPVQAEPEFQGGKQRWIGIDSKDAKVQELTVADLGNFTKVIEQLINHAAARVRVPVHYILGAIVNVSADTLRAAETGLVLRVKRRTKVAGESWEEVVRLGHKIRQLKAASEGNQLEDTSERTETRWRDPEIMSEAARVDALIKMRTLGVPLKFLWRKWGMTAEEIKQAWQDHLDELAAQGLELGLTGDGQQPQINAPQTPQAAAALPAGPAG